MVVAGRHRGREGLRRQGSTGGRRVVTGSGRVPPHCMQALGKVAGQVFSGSIHRCRLGESIQIKTPAMWEGIL